MGVIPRNTLTIKKQVLYLSILLKYSILLEVRMDFAYKFPVVRGKAGGERVFHRNGTAENDFKNIS